ncbi:MAG: multicopper oxidase family protein [Sulfurimonas sp.]|jgi:FtsP/CotA-like multicopper oxidase with cupredoxin domain
MERRHFLHYSAITVGYLLSGCEKHGDTNKNRAQKSSATDSSLEKPLAREEKIFEKVMPFTQKLKIPDEVNFTKVGKAMFTAQKSRVNIFTDAQTDVLTFQGNLPNPTIRINRGGTFDLDFINKLAAPTIIHWHGLIVPEEMDGHPKDAIATNQSKHYHYPIEQNAGTYWYHTHPHGRTGEEIYHGLSGLYIIEDKEENYLNLPKDEFEIPLVIQDRRFDKKRQLLYKNLNFPPDNNGVLGDVILVNATPFPYHEVKTGKYRLRILNGSSVRTYKLAFDTIEQFMLIGTDAGLLEEAVSVESVVLSVAERIDIIVDFKDKQVGDKVILKTLGFKDGNNFGLNPDYPGFDTVMDIMQFHITENFKDASILPKKLANIHRMKESEAVKTRRITMEVISGGIWTLDKKPYDMHRIDQRVKLGSTEIWELKNSVHMAHPFHMHGVRFQVLDRSGKIDFPTDKGWKDTVIVMPNEMVRIIVHFTMPGFFIYHCHILEHEDHAMMANFLVE